ncbi:MAG: hypothetical protein V3W18_12470 [candidate division Zixibacteria bacterium]
MSFKDILKQKWPYFYFFILTVFVFADFIFSDKMLFGSDNIEAGLFFRGFYAEFFKTYHRVPLWNPYIFGGLPFVDAMHGDIFFPFSVIQFVLPLHKSLGYKLALTLPMAGIFTYLYLRKMMMSKWAGVFGATAYMLSGFIVSLVYAGHDGRMYITSMLPLLLYTMEIGFRRGRIIWWWPFSLAFGIMVLANHPQFAYFAMWCVGSYFIMKVIFLFKESRSFKLLLIPGFGFLFAMLFGVTLGLVQIWPAQDYVRNYSPRSGEGKGYEYAASWGLHAEEAISQIVPGFAGVSNLQNHPPLGLKNPYWGKNYFKINSEYAGMVAISLGLLGLFLFRDRHSYFFLGTALFALLYALGDSGVIFKICYNLVPLVNKFRAPSTIMFLFCFSFAFLAARTVDFLEKAKKIPNSKKLFRWILILAGVYFLIGLIFSGAGAGIMKIYTSVLYPNIETGQWNNLQESLPRISLGFIIGALILTVIAVTFRAAVRKKMAFWVTAVVLIMLVMVDSWIIENRKFIKTVDHRPYFAKPEPVSFLEAQDDVFRSFTFPGSMPNQNSLAMFGLDQVNGYHGNQLKWYNEFIGENFRNLFSYPAALPLTNSKYVVTQRSIDFPRFQEVSRSSGGVIIYEDKGALPRARIVREFVVNPDPDSALKQLFAPDFDYAGTIIIDRRPTLIITPPDSLTLAGDTIEFLEGPPDRIRLKATLSSPGLLAVQNNWYPHWKAYEGEIEHSIFRADFTFMAVELDEGEHELEFRLENPNYIYARAITEISWLVVGIGGIIALIRRKIKKPITQE